MVQKIDIKTGFLEISDADVLKAMSDMKGYIDITPGDFKEVYRIAYVLARNRMLTSIKASDIMSRPVHVIRSDADLIRTATFLAENHISGAPVVDDSGKIVGVVSEKDFITQTNDGKTGSFMGIIADCLKNRGCMAIPMRRLGVAEIMTRPAITASEDITLKDISALLMDRGINRLPIVDNDEKPIGIVTRSDLVGSYCLLG